MQFEIYANLAKFKTYIKEVASKTIILKNARNYLEPEPYIKTDHSWENDTSSQLEKTLTQIIKMTQFNFEKISRHQETF